MARIVKSGASRDELSGGRPTEDGAEALSSSDVLDTADGDEADEDVLTKGTSIGRYLVLERLGAGAMGVVYAAYDPELDRKIALKLLSRQQGTGGDSARREERLVREAKAIAKLSHPNVVGIFDVGVHEGQVFMAMEYLGGGTLRDWMTTKRSWREVVKMFIEVGQGLAAAHAEGLIHRDFKPDNVLLDRAGKPKVADFGLVRLRGARAESHVAGEINDPEVITGEQPLPIAETALAQLTRTGSIAGTPAYMAPEQFLGGPIDARTDQFAFCVALYEALYGERPFSGETVLAIGGQVAKGRVREAAKDAQVPRWLRQLVLRGLQRVPESRFETMALLVSMLGVDPMRVRWRWGATAALVVGLVAAIAAVRSSSMRRQRQIDSDIASKVREAEAALAIAAGAKPRFLSKRAAAFAAFAAMNRSTGEHLWREVLSAVAVLDASYEETERAFEAALLIDENRLAVRDRLLEVILDRVVLAETLGQNASASVHAAKLRRLDHSGRFSARLTAPGTLALTVVPADVELRLESYRTDGSGARTPHKQQEVTATSLRNLQLAPGSYRLTARRVGAKTDVFYPFVLARSESLTATLNIPDDAQIPAGFVYVPPGRFLFGEADEPFRTAFLDTVPIGAASTGAFFIARYETTYADWIAYLESLPPRQRLARLPHVANSVEGRYIGAVDLKEVSPRGWRLRLTPAGVEYTATSGNLFVYPGRAERRAQDWGKFPVSGISARDAEAYARWLASTGRVPRARLCTEKEWERAARGADDRRFPHGDYLGDDEANFDETYGRRPDAFGPDEVGAHPQSVSPFGVQDLAGNVIEMTTSSLEPNGLVARGGGFYHDRRSAWASNRVPLELGTRVQTFGLRICADAPSETADNRGAR